MPRFTGLFLAAMVTAGCAGGEDELPREEVLGTVTVDGAPLARGQILFNPASASAGTRAGASIVDGSYRLAKSEGPVPGLYSVLITTGSAVEGDPDDPARKFRPTREALPARFNARTTLQVEIKANASNSLDFPLTSK